MKKPKAPRVPVLENAFEVNLPKLLRAVKASGRPEVVLVDGDEHTVAVVSETRLAIHLGGLALIVDIVAVSCLKNRLRPLLKCPRAHEGNFQSLYFRGGELACRHCHALRYQSNLASTTGERARLRRDRLISKMGGQPGDTLPPRPVRSWVERYYRFTQQLSHLSEIHYHALQVKILTVSGRPPIV